MKLSKVKKICMDQGEIMVKKAHTGLDVDTWIGTYEALYPVHGIRMTGPMAVRIWEIEGNKLKDLRIQDDSENGAITIASTAEIEALPFLVDPGKPEDGEEPGLRHVATVGKFMILQNRETGRARVLHENYLAPIEGARIFFVPMDDEDMKIAVYGDGELQAVLKTMRWENSDSLVRAFSVISSLWMGSEIAREARE